MNATEALNELREKINQMIEGTEEVIKYAAKDKNYPVAASLTFQNEARSNILYVIDGMLEKIEQKKEK